MADRPALGWIGTGIMGGAMARRLLAAGYAVTLHNRTPERARPLLESGARLAASPREVAAASDIVFTMVGMPADVEEVILGGDGVLQGMAKGGIICDMTTSSAGLAKKIAAEAGKKGVFALDAPVTGGDTGARKGSLSIFAAGDYEAYARLLPCLEIMGKTIMYCGGAGMGQMAKLANQVNVAGVTFGMCESLLFAQQAGIDVEKWLELVVRGSSGSAALDNRGRRLLAGDYEPGFFIDHFVKDLGICLEECRRMGIVLPCTALAEEFYRIMQAQGEGRRGTQALLPFLARLSGREWKPARGEE